MRAEGDVEPLEEGIRRAQHVGDLFGAVVVEAGAVATLCGLLRAAHRERERTR